MGFTGDRLRAEFTAEALEAVARKRRGQDIDVDLPEREDLEEVVRQRAAEFERTNGFNK